jgi:transposase
VQDKELYQQILGLDSPWVVSNVELDMKKSEIRVYVDHPRGSKFCCAECDEKLPCHDHTEERRWRHLDSCQLKTFLIARVPRVNCPTHGVKNATVPWAEPHSRFTMMFERFAIDVLLAAQTVKGAMALLRTKWDQTWGIIERAVARGQARKGQAVIPRLGIDEKAFKKGHSYVTLLYDIDNSTVVAISQGNDADAAKACFSQLSAKQLAGIEAISMDMSASYVKATKETIPLAEEKIVHDRFHVMQLASKAVDQTRRAEHKQLKEAGDDRLTKTRYLWLKSQENLTEEERVRFDDVYTQQLETGKAWAFKEMLRDLWHHSNPKDATKYFNDWYKRVIHTKLEPMKKVAKTIKQRLANVVSYCKLQITNAVAEGMNSKIMSIKRRVGGFRNVQNYMTAIFFYCGGLDLYPR